MNAATNIIATDSNTLISAKLQSEAYSTDLISFEAINEVVNVKGTWIGWLPLELVVFNDNINPRKNINSDEFNKLRNSLINNGQKQNIGCRISLSSEGKIEVVWGNTRTKAMLDINGVTCILASVEEMSDEEALTYAGAENLDRAQMTPVEEADLAVRKLLINGNNESELCKELGWSKSKLASRIALTHVSDPVRNALTQRSIDIGHAEILSTLTDETQEKLLKRIVDEGMSVGDARTVVKSKIEREISHAKFDTTECNSCHHNTSSTSDLFATTIDGARCRNGGCWTEKTKAFVESIVSEKQSEFSTVKMSHELAEGTFTLVSKESLGAGQAKACLACENYGCVVNTKIGNEGAVRTGVCFDVACNLSKKTELSDLQAKALTNKTSDKKGQSKTNKATAKSAAADSKVKEPNSTVSPVDTKKPSKNMIQYSVEKVNEAATDVCIKDPKIILATSVASVITSLTKTNEFCESHKISYDRYKAFETLLPSLLVMEESRLNELNRLAVVEMVNQDVASSELDKAKYNASSKAILAYKEFTFKGAWTVDIEFLNAMPSKGYMEVVLNESGFVEAYTKANGENSFSTLWKKKVPDIKKDIIAFDFDWSNYLPSVLEV